MKPTDPTAPTPAQPIIRSTARSLPIALLRARETVMGPIRDMLAKSQITEQRWRVLRVLDEGGPQEQTAIAHAACLLLPSLTRIVGAMRAEGLVTRATDPGDRRRSIVSITDAGRKLLRDHAAEGTMILERLEAELGTEKLETLLDLLEDLRQVSL